MASEDMEKRIDDLHKLLQKVLERVESIQEDVLTVQYLPEFARRIPNDDKTVEKLRAIGKFPFPQ